MKEYLENRINELIESQTIACKKVFDITISEDECKTWHEAINEITGRRRELEDALKFFIFNNN